MFSQAFVNIYWDTCRNFFFFGKVTSWWLIVYLHGEDDLWWPHYTKSTASFSKSSQANLALVTIGRKRKGWLFRNPYIACHEGKTEWDISSLQCLSNPVIIIFFLFEVFLSSFSPAVNHKNERHSFLKLYLILCFYPRIALEIF